MHSARHLLLIAFFLVLAQSAGARGIPRNSRLSVLSGNGVPVTDTLLPYTGPGRDTRVASSMVYFHLACISARLKLYPLAMKLFLKSSKLKQPFVSPRNDAREDYPGGWALTPEEDSLLSLPEQPEAGSKMASMSQLLEVFRDSARRGGDDGDQYALILLVKQPVFNKRKVFTGIGNVGHTFVSLIRFNRDKTYTSRTFGFYPKKSYPLAASPIFPSVPGIFRDDTGHDWDEMAGRFITKNQFRAIVRTMQSYAHRRYHLSKNNCTDFGLTIAALGGIEVNGTAGHWPLGHGNNPAWTGQSILAGDLCGADSVKGPELFVALHHPDLVHDGIEK